MIDEYDKQERIAIKICSHIPERESIKQTEREYSTPECIARLKAHQERVKLDHSEKSAKKTTRFSYD